MKALTATSQGYVVADVAQPSLRPGHVLVQVQHASVNPVDWKIADSPMRWVFGLRSGLPYVPGMDFSGTVLDVGAGVVDVARGDRVAGVATMLKGQKGRFATHVVVHAAQVARVPDGVAADVAACLPVVGTTAWQGLFQLGGLKQGQRVLVLGASGGVGHIAVQLGKAHGAHVTGVCSARNVALVTGLGCDVVVDYGAQDPLALAERFDVVFDTIGTYAAARCRALLTPGGLHVTITPGPSWNRRTRGFMARNDAGPLRHVLDDVAAGRVRPVIAARFPLSRGADAIAASKAGRAAGKIVLDID